jgi:hypothetical protein
MGMKLQEYCEYRLTGLFLDGHTAKQMKLNEYEILIYDPKEGDVEFVKILCEKYNHLNIQSIIALILS